MTINQAAGQEDPTSITPVVFDVIFSEPVTGFTSADVDLSATTAPGTLMATVMGSGTTYTVSVTGMTDDGLIIVTIPADVVTDAAGNNNVASTSTDNTVTYIFCAADGGEITNSLSSESLEICQGTDPGFTFDATGEAADATYLYTFLLVNDADGTIVETAANGDFNLAALTVGNYTVYGLSYANFNTPDNIAAYLAGKTISDVQNDDAGNDFCLDLTDTTVNGNTNKITVNPNPTAVISPDPAQLCEDDDLILDGNPSGGTPPYTHAWTGAGASFLSATNVQSPTFNSPNPGMFDLVYTVTDNKGCSGTDNISVRVDPQVIINPLTPQEICSTKKLPLADLYEGISYSGQTSELIYTWSIKETEGENGTLSETSSTDPNAGFYTPGKDAIKRGYVTLILTVDNPNDTCEPVSVSVRVKVLKVDCGKFPWSGN